MRQVLDQFERNVDQQQFLMTIFNTLNERTSGLAPRARRERGGTHSVWSGQSW